MKDIRKATTLLTVVTITLVLSFVWVWAEDTTRIAKVSGISGAVNIMKGGGEKTFKAFKGMGLLKGDTVITGNDSNTTMEMDKDKVIKIGESTKILIGDLSKAISSQAGKTSINLLNGKILVTINKKLEKDSKFEIVTPTAVMGVRGTRFYVLQDENSTRVGVLDGTVGVTLYLSSSNNDGIQLEEILLIQDQELVINKGTKRLEDLHIRSITQRTLDLFVLQTIKEDPSRINPSLLQNIDQVIRERIEQQRQQERQNQQNENQQDQSSNDTVQNNVIVYEEPQGTVSYGGPAYTLPPAATPVVTASGQFQNSRVILTGVTAGQEYEITVNGLSSPLLVVPQTYYTGTQSIAFDATQMNTLISTVGTSTSPMQIRKAAGGGYGPSEWTTLLPSIGGQTAFTDAVIDTRSGWVDLDDTSREYSNDGGITWESANMDHYVSAAFVAGLNTTNDFKARVKGINNTLPSASQTIPLNSSAGYHDLSGIRVTAGFSTISKGSSQLDIGDAVLLRSQRTDGTWNNWERCTADTSYMLTVTSANIPEYNRPVEFKIIKDSTCAPDSSVTASYSIGLYGGSASVNSIKTMDDDFNGKVDHIWVRFNVNVSDATLLASDVTVVDPITDITYTVASARTDGDGDITGIAPDGDSADSEYLIIRVNELPLSDFDTGSQPVVTIAQDKLQDTYGNLCSSISGAAADDARPYLTGVSGNASQLVLTFSENINPTVNTGLITTTATITGYNVNNNILTLNMSAVTTGTNVSMSPGNILDLYGLQYSGGMFSFDGSSWH